MNNVETLLAILINWVSFIGGYLVALRRVKK